MNIITQIIRLGNTNPIKTDVNSSAPEEQAVPFPLVTSTVPNPFVTSHERGKYEIVMCIVSYLL
jgi:hypothetical protein